MSEASIAEQWLAETWVHGPSPEDDDGAGYVDAARLALMFASVAVDHADGEPAPSSQCPVTPHSFRDAMGCLATGVCVVSTVVEGDDVAMTANSVTSVSLVPPLVLVCIARTARFHDAILAAGAWGLSILDASAHELSVRFARPGRPQASQLENARFRRGPETGMALLESSVVQAECVTTQVHAAGDHDIVVGRVVSLSRQGEGAHPLLFHRGRYRWLLA